MNLIIDIGNTLIKLAVFDKNELVKTATVEQINDELLLPFFKDYQIDNCMYASVVTSPEQEELLKKYNFILLTHSTLLPLTINYQSPTTLGLDRIAGVVGASTIYNNEDVLVIDIGTCVTYDFMNADKEYLGGGISPGFQMRFKTLEQNTSKLPLVNFNIEQLKLIGDTTETSIISGVYHGVKHEIEGVINQYILQYTQLKVVVTGGDLNLFDLAPKNRIFADEFLVLKGLNEILTYNEK